MTTIKIIAKNYNNRSELEKKLRDLGIELTPVVKSNYEYEITGTQWELSRLHLSSRTTFYGIKCSATDEKLSKETSQEKPQRGQIVDFGLNNQLKKTK